MDKCRARTSSRGFQSPPNVHQSSACACATQGLDLAWNQALLAGGLIMHDSGYGSEDVEDELEDEPELFELGLFWVAPAA